MSDLVENQNFGFLMTRLIYYIVVNMLYIIVFEMNVNSQKHFVDLAKLISLPDLIGYEHVEYFTENRNILNT